MIRKQTNDDGDQRRVGGGGLVGRLSAAKIYKTGGLRGLRLVIICFNYSPAGNELCLTVTW